MNPPPSTVSHAIAKPEKRTPGIRLLNRRGHPTITEAFSCLLVHAKAILEGNGHGQGKSGCAEK